MRKYILLPFLLILPSIANNSCATLPDNESIDQLIIDVTESCNSVYSGKGSYTYKYKDVSDLRLSGNNIDLAKKTIDMKFGNDISGKKTAWKFSIKIVCFIKI